MVWVEFDAIVWIVSADGKEDAPGRVPGAALSDWLSQNDLGGFQKSLFFSHSV